MNALIESVRRVSVIQETDVLVIGSGADGGDARGRQGDAAVTVQAQRVRSKSN